MKVTSCLFELFAFLLMVGCSGEKWCLLLFPPGSDGKAEDESDTTKKDGLMPDLCVICLEQEYNSVFVP